MSATEALFFWMARPLAEAITTFLVMLPFLLAYFIWQARRHAEQRKCPHEKVNEDQACNAWCRACGKNLGFIGAWRDRQAGIVEDASNPRHSS